MPWLLCVLSIEKSILYECVCVFLLYVCVYAEIDGIYSKWDNVLRSTTGVSQYYSIYKWTYTNEMILFVWLSSLLVYF